MKRVLAYRYRWMVLLSLVMLLFSVEIQWMNLSPVGRIANEFFQDKMVLKSISIVDILSFIFMGGFVVFAIPSSYMINKCGIVVSVYISSILCVAASVLKLFSGHSLATLFIAQVMFSCAQAIVLNLGTATVAEWFPIRERGMAMGVLSAFQYIALLFVLIFSPYLADKPLDRLIGIYSAISGGGSIISALLIREKPPTPSSLVEPPDLSYLKSFKRIGPMRSLRGIILIFGVSWGASMSMLVRSDMIASQIGVGTTFFGLILIGSGALGAFVLPGLSDQFRKRKGIYSISLGCSLVGIVLMIMSKSPVCASIGTGIFGFFVFGSIPIGLQYGAEIGNPIAEEIVQTWMTFSSQAIGAIILLLSMDTSRQVFRNMLMFVTGLLFACFLGSTFLTESKVIITEEERLGKEINREFVEEE